MATIRVIDENGEMVEREVVSRDVAAVTDSGEFRPAVAQRVEYDAEGEMSQVTTVCGETENRRESDKGADITVEGIVVEDELPDLKSLDKGDRITLISDVMRGEVVVKRVTIEQTADLVELIQDGEAQLAFGFQLQLKTPE